jgi:hypothetical protein
MQRQQLMMVLTPEGSRVPRFVRMVRRASTPPPINPAFSHGRMMHLLPM